jgi:hypothetical protein
MVTTSPASGLASSSVSGRRRALDLVDRHDRLDRLDRVLRRDLVEGERLGDFAGDRQQRLAGRAVLGRDELQALGRDVPVRRQVLVEGRVYRVGDVIDHDAAGPLETDEGIGPPVDLAQRQRLRLGPLVV